MKPDRQSLADEAHAAIRRAQSSPAATVLVDERRRLLPFVVVGAAVLGVLAGTLAGQGGNAARGGMAVGLGAGIAAGMALGWPLYWLAGRLVGDRSPRFRSQLLIHAGVVIPAYLVAGIAASLATLAAASGLDGAGQAVGSTLTFLAWGSLIIIPLSGALARSRQTALVRSTGLRGAVVELEDRALGGDDEDVPTSRVGGAVVSALIWFVAGSVLILTGLAYVAGAFPERYATATAMRGDLLGIALLVAWVGTMTAGAAFTHRIFFGRRRQRRKQSTRTAGPSRRRRP